MTQQEFDDILLVGKFMGINNLFEYRFEKDVIAGAYISDDEDGYIDYVDQGIWWYEPHRDWNTLMQVVNEIEKDESIAFLIIKNGWDNRGLHQITIAKCFNMEENRERKPLIEIQGNDKKKAVYEAVVAYIKLQNV